MSIPISKERFVKIINQIKEQHDFEHELWALGRKYNQDSDWIINSPLEDVLIELLQEFMGDSLADTTYFIYELDFGRDYEPGYVTEPDGTVLDFSCPESLYDYLAAKYEKAHT